MDGQPGLMPWGGDSGERGDEVWLQGDIHEKCDEMAQDLPAFHPEMISFIYKYVIFVCN